LSNRQHDTQPYTHKRSGRQKFGGGHFGDKTTSGSGYDSTDEFESAGFLSDLSKKYAVGSEQEVLLSQRGRAMLRVCQ